MNKRTLGDVTCLTHGNVTAGTIQSLKIDVRLAGFLYLYFVGTYRLTIFLEVMMLPFNLRMLVVVLSELIMI